MSKAGLKPASLHTGGRILSEIRYQPIGIIHSPFLEPEGAPIQPTAAAGVAGRVEVFPEYSAGLADLEGFSHIFLLYHFHRVQSVRLRVVPFLDREERGVFATRAPSRPNALGMSLVRLQGIEGSLLHVLDIDVLDGTPLLDIKPYYGGFDRPDEVRCGWLDAADSDVSVAKADGRFSE
jgi:tRNA (adenine37-N6)-methyltransferase